MHSRCNITLLILAFVVALAACDEDGKEGPVDASQIVDAKPGSPRAETSGDDDESEEAVKESSRTEATSETAGTVEQTPPLPVQDYFKANNVESLTGKNLRVDALAGQQPSETYNSLRVQPAGRNEYGAAVQMWKLDSPKAAAERVADLREQYLSVDDPAEDAPVTERDAFVTDRQKLWQYVFNPEGQPYVASVSCAQDFCKSMKVVYEIGSKVNNRILGEDANSDDAKAADPPKKTEKTDK